MGALNLGIGVGVGLSRYKAARPPAPLLQHLLAYWTFEETSGFPANSVAGNPTFDYLDGSDPGSDAGKIGNARVWAGNSSLVPLDSRFHYIDTNTQSFSFWFWFKTAQVGFNAIMGTGNGVAGGNRGWILGLFGTSFIFDIFWGAADNTRATSPQYTVNQWQFAAFKFDHTTQRPYVSLNGGAWATSAAPLPSPMQKNAGWAFRVGAPYWLLVPYSGLFDEMGYCYEYAMTDADRDFLYNGGAGRTWAQIAAYTI